MFKTNRINKNDVSWELGPHFQLRSMRVSSPSTKWVYGSKVVKNCQFPDSIHEMFWRHHTSDQWCSLREGRSAGAAQFWGRHFECTNNRYNIIYSKYKFIFSNLWGVKWGKTKISKFEFDVKFCSYTGLVSINGRQTDTLPLPNPRQVCCFGTKCCASE